MGIMEDDTWSFYIILVIVIIVAKLLIVISVCCVHYNRKRQRILVQRRLRAPAVLHQPVDLYGYDQNTSYSPEFQPAISPGPNGILGVHPPPYSEQSPKPPPYSPSNVYPIPAAQAMSTPADDPRVDIPQTDGLVTKI